VKKVWITLVVLVLVGGAGAALVAKKVVSSRKAVAHVHLARVERRDLTSTVTAPGRVQAAAAVDISAEVPGRIVEMAVAEGDTVAKGDLLLRLEDGRYRGRVQQAEASLRTARANLNLSRARLEKAGRDLERLEGLRKVELASDEAVDRSRTDDKVARAEVEARAQEVARSEAALTIARDDLAKTVYRAPIAGLVSRLNVEEGENVIVGTMNNPGTVILSIADMSVMEVEAEVDETDVVTVRPGQEAAITVDAIPDVEFPGTVATVGNSGRGRSRGSTDQAVNFEVTVRFRDADPRLRPGMTADVEIRTETRRGVLTVPIQALVARSRGSVLDLRAEAAGEDSTHVEPPEGTDRETWRKEVLEGLYRVEDGVVHFVEVEAGIADGSRIQVEGDVKEEDRVVSGPYRVLRDLKEGTHVKEIKDRRSRSKD